MHQQNYNEIYANLDDAVWLDLLKQSVNEPVVEGVPFPRFPGREVQERFVGSSYDVALEEASEFYSFFKEASAKGKKPIGEHSIVLDFGCGWGRYIRFLMKNVDEAGIFGSDIMPLAVEICQDSGLPGNFSLIEDRGRLPFEDATFDNILAYSVFTHLPKETHLHWMKELARVSKPGAVFCLTLEPRHFIERIQQAEKEEGNSFLAGLARYVSDFDALYKKFDQGEIAFIPTGGGDNLTSEIYGDAIVPLKFIKKNWGKYFQILSYQDFPDKIWYQARLVVRRKTTFRDLLNKNV